MRYFSVNLLRKVKIETNFLYSKVECSKFKPFIIPVPVEIQVHIVPHLKALICIELGLLKSKPWWYFCCVPELSEKR